MKKATSRLYLAQREKGTENDRGIQIPSFIATAIPPVNISTESVARSVTSTGNVTYDSKTVIGSVTLPILTNTTETSTVDQINKGKKTIIISKGKKKTPLIKEEYYRTF